MKRIIKASVFLLLTCISFIEAKVPKKKNKTIPVKAYRCDIEYPNLIYPRTTTFQEAREVKETALLAFDLNDVVFSKNMSVIPEVINEIRKKKGFLYTIRLGVNAKKLNKERVFINSDGKKEKKSFDSILTKHDCPNDPCQQYIDDLRMAMVRVNNFNPPMVKLLYELHISGHHNYMFSNIGKNVLNAIIKNLSCNKPSLDVITHNEYLYFMTFLKNTNHSFITGPENNWIVKPNPDTYTIFLNKHTKKKKNRIFIDDKKENVIAAIENGFDFGIVYKNPQDLTKILYNVLHLVKR